MADMRVYLELTGARTGQTCVLGKYQFVGGRTVVSGDGHKVASAVRFLGRVYSAFPTGSPELKARRAQEKAEAPGKLEAPGNQQEAGNGDAPTDEVAAGGQAGEVPGNVQSDGSPEEPAADGAGDAAAAPGGAQHGPPGYRHPDARLREAILNLDKDNDELWTAEGRPRLDALTKLPGMAGVTRRDVDRVAPEVVRTQ